MIDSTTRSSAAYITFSVIVVLAGLALSVAARDHSLSDRSGLVVPYLLLAPFAFYQVGLLLLITVLFGAH